jgi:hypothetical protein
MAPVTESFHVGDGVKKCSFAYLTSGEESDNFVSYMRRSFQHFTTGVGDGVVDQNFRRRSIKFRHFLDGPIQ